MNPMRPECGVTGDVINKLNKRGKKANLLWFYPVTRHDKSGTNE